MTWELTSGRFEDCVVNSVCDMVMGLQSFLVSIQYLRFRNFG